MKDTGLGDTIARALDAIGVKRKGCGCEARRQRLNKLIPYGGKVNKDFREEGSQIIERHEHSIGGGLANVTDEEDQMAKDRCGQCGSPRASSIHNRESNNVEIRLASHAFVEALPPRTLAELQSELKQVEGAYLSEINPDTKYLHSCWSWCCQWITSAIWLRRSGAWCPTCRCFSSRPARNRGCLRLANDRVLSARR